jgi:hypothetical protein
MKERDRYRRLIRLYITEELDDVDCSLSTILLRDKEIEELEESFSTELVMRAYDFAQSIADRAMFFASGAPRNGEQHV